MKGIIYALVGSSGVGKTYLAEHIVAKMPNVKIIRSTSTRPRRGQEDDRYYKFVAVEEFQQKAKNRELLNINEYGGNFYGYEKAELDNILSDYNGIFAILEPAINLIRSAGYTAKTVHVISDKIGRQASEQRKNDDEARAKIQIPFDIEIYNSFEDHGKGAIIKLQNFIERTATI